jgi:hypothetical protein
MTGRGDTSAFGWREPSSPECVTGLNSPAPIFLLGALATRQSAATQALDRIAASQVLLAMTATRYSIFIHGAGRRRTV